MGEITVVGVRTRAREALAMAEEASGSSGAISNSSPGKKIIKKASAITAMPYDVHELRSRRRIELTSGKNSDSSTTCRPETSSSSTDVVVFPANANCSTGEVSSDFPTSCSSSSGEDFKDCMEIVADPEVESSLTSSKNSECLSFARGENKVDVEALKSDGLDSTPRYPDTKSTVQIKMPSNSEIEEFFAVAEKDIQKRFCEKYNFDIVKEVPLKGRYEWVPIKP